MRAATVFRKSLQPHATYTRSRIHRGVEVTVSNHGDDCVVVIHFRFAIPVLPASVQVDKKTLEEYSRLIDAAKSRAKASTGHGGRPVSRRRAQSRGALISSCQERGWHDVLERDWTLTQRDEGQGRQIVTTRRETLTLPII